MRPGTRLAIILASIILFWGVVGYLVFRGDNPKKRAVEVAELALKASVDNPKSVRIIGISQPDSVFGKEYITMDEKMAISMAMMKINEKVMKLTDGLENFNPDDKEIAGLMERQMEAMSVLRSITPQANDNITKSFTGWKVKIEYEGKDSDGKPYHSEYWLLHLPGDSTTYVPVRIDLLWHHTNLNHFLRFQPRYALQYPYICNLHNYCSVSH